MSKTKLSISLIKERIPINRVLKPDIPSLTLANGLVLYYKNNQPASPKWVNSFLKGEIPFFSKVSFRSVSSRLKHYGFKVSIKGINRTYRENNNNEGGNEK